MKNTILTISIIVIAVTVVGMAGLYSMNITHMSDATTKNSSLNCGGGSSHDDSKDDSNGNSDTSSGNTHKH